MPNEILQGLSQKSLWRGRHRHESPERVQVRDLRYVILLCDSHICADALDVATFATAGNAEKRKA